MTTTTTIPTAIFVTDSAIEGQNLYVASVLGGVPAFQFSDASLSIEFRDVFTGLAVEVHYMNDTGVNLIGDSSSSDTVMDAIQAKPKHCFRLEDSNGQIRTPTVLSEDNSWVIQRCRVRLDTSFIENADFRALLQHANAFQMAMGGVPTGIPVPTKNISSVSELYLEAVSSVVPSQNMVLPFNGDSGPVGFLVVQDAVEGNDYRCRCFGNGELRAGMRLQRVVTFQETVSGAKHEFRSNVGEVISVM